MKKWWGVLLVLAVSLGVNGYLIWIGQKAQIAQESDKYPLLSKRIFIDNQNDMLINFTDLRRSLQVHMSGALKPEEKAGLYFEYLPSGVSIGINEKDSYFMASLLKIPLAMAVYKDIEAGMLRWDGEVVLKAEDLDKTFGDLWKRGEGWKTTVGELVMEMLIKSDNTSKTALYKRMSIGRLDEVFDYLDIPKELEVNTPVVTPKNYSSILRSLYLSSYLQKTNSQAILELMTKSVFKDKLEGKLPAEVRVAHKVGTLDTGDPGTSIFSDCGIVYLPNRPYMLCVMTKTSEDRAREIISESSRLVYEYVRSAK